MAIARRNNFEFTRVAVHVAIEDDTGRIEAALLALALFVALLTRTGLFVSGLVLLAVDIAQAADFTAKVFTIGLKSIAYGLGVTL